MRRAVATTIAVFTIAAVSGCPKVDIKDIKGILEEADPYLPKVQFKNLKVNDLDFESADTDFVFSVSNPNPVAITLSSFSWDLSFEGTHALEGVSADGLSLPASGSTRVKIPVSLVFAEVFEMVKATRGKDNIDFALEGHFGFNTPAGEVKVPFKERGDFPAPRAPKFSFDKVRVDNLNLMKQTATIAVDLSVDNAHGSSVSFQQFAYDLSLGGKGVASGRVPSLGSVDGSSKGKLTLPVDVNLVAAGATVIDALTGKGTLKAGLDASMDVDTPFGALPLSIDESGRVSVE